MKNINIRSVLFSFMSIIPGLGLLALQEFRAGAIAFVVVFALFILTIFANTEFSIEFAVAFFWLSWVYQIVYTYQVAERARKRESGESTVKGFQKIKVPKGTPFKKRVAVQAYQIVESQLKSEENLQAAVLAVGGGIVVNQSYLGLTDEHLIVLKMDMFGKPLDLERHTLTEIDKVSIGKGVLNRKFEFKSGKKKHRYKVGAILKGELIKFEEAFNKLEL